MGQRVAIDLGRVFLRMAVLRNGVPTLLVDRGNEARTVAAPAVDQAGTWMAARRVGGSKTRGLARTIADPLVESTAKPFEFATLTALCNLARQTIQYRIDEDPAETAVTFRSVDTAEQRGLVLQAAESAGLPNLHVVPGAEAVLALLIAERRLSAGQPVLLLDAGANELRLTRFDREGSTWCRTGIARCNDFGGETIRHITSAEIEGQVSCVVGGRDQWSADVVERIEREIVRCIRALDSRESSSWVWMGVQTADKVLDIEGSVTREALEQAISNSVRSALSVLESNIEGVSAIQSAVIAVVGEATRAPLSPRELRHRWAKCEIVTLENPGSAAVRGAAVADTAWLEKIEYGRAGARSEECQGEWNHRAVDEDARASSNESTDGSALCAGISREKCGASESVSDEYAVGERHDHDASGAAASIGDDTSDEPDTREVVAPPKRPSGPRQAIVPSRFDVVQEVKRDSYSTAVLAVDRGDGGQLVRTRRFDWNSERGRIAFRPCLLSFHVSHQNIDKIVGFGADAVNLYIATNATTYESLRQIVHCALGGTLPMSNAIRITRNLLTGVEELHEFSIMHRNVRPEKVLIIHADNSVLLSGFDLAVLAPRCGPRRGSAGSLPYLAPEALGHIMFVQSDLYSTAVLLCEMLSGEVPLWDFESTMLRRLVAESSPRRELLPETCSPALVALLARALAKNPRSRRFSAADLQPLLTADADAWPYKLQE